LIRARYLRVRKNGSLLLTVALVIGVICYVGYVTDKNVRGELHLAALQASADLGGLFREFAAPQHFTDRRVLEYCSTEMGEKVSSWTFISSRVSLQAFGAHGGVLYDSSDGKIYSYATAAAIPEPLSVSPRFSREILSLPLYAVPQSIDDNWTLRTVITTGDYLRAQSKTVVFTSGPISLGILALFFLPRYRRRVITHQHFEDVIDTLIESPPESKTADEFIALLPQLVRKALDADSAAVYLVKGDRLELRAFEQNKRGGGSNPAQDSIPRRAYFIEASAARTQCTMFVYHMYDKPRVARPLEESRRSRLVMKLIARMKTMKLNASGRAPYVAVPILDPHDGAVLGVLTTEKLHGFEESNATELETLVRLVMLLFDKARTRNEIFNETVRQTQQSALIPVVGVLAHNLKGKLVPVGLIASNLAKNWATADQTTADTLRLVEEEMKYGIVLIERINDYCKLGVKTDSSGPNKPIDLNDVLTKICAFFEIYCDTRQIRLRSHFADAFRPLVVIDEQDLRQVISNLFINADEALRDMPRQGTERIMELFVERSTAPQGVRIRIADNGPGISPELHEQIFEDKFTTKEKGTGTGLAYSLRVIRQAGGTLELDRLVQQGATFNIYLPTSEVNS
jgi:signal transduction histidine kinase